MNPPVAEHLSSKCITVQQIICIVLFSKNLSKKGTSCYHKKLKTHRNVVFNFPTSLLYISPKIHGSQTYIYENSGKIPQPFPLIFFWLWKNSEDEHSHFKISPWGKKRMKNQNWFGAFFYFYIPGKRRETSNEGRTGGYIGLSNCFNKNPWQDNGGSLYLPWFPFLSLVWFGVSLQTVYSCPCQYVQQPGEHADLLCI